MPFLLLLIEKKKPDKFGENSDPFKDLKRELLDWANVGTTEAKQRCGARRLAGNRLYYSLGRPTSDSSKRIPMNFNRSRRVRNRPCVTVVAGNGKLISPGNLFDCETNFVFLKKWQILKANPAGWPLFNLFNKNSHVQIFGGQALKNLSIQLISLTKAFDLKGFFQAVTCSVSHLIQIFGITHAVQIERRW